MQIHILRVEYANSFISGNTFLLDDNGESEPRWCHNNLTLLPYGEDSMRISLDDSGILWCIIAVLCPPATESAFYLMMTHYDSVVVTKKEIYGMI